MKNPENLTLEELGRLIEDFHALMWYGDGCEVCANCVLVHREPYYKTTCKLKECRPLWRGFSEEDT